MLVAELAQRAAFLSDLSAKCGVAKPAVTMELGGTERNEQQKKARLALETLKLSKHS